MVQSFRHTDILEIARREGQVAVDDLAERLHVTAQTIRRDLSELAQAGRLERVHGGARLASSVANIGYAERRQLAADAKSTIAARAAADIPENCSVFLNIGTSTEAVARALLSHRGLMVFTNNINVANILAENAQAEVMVVGGRLRRSDGGLVGDITREVIERFKFDVAVIGCSALDEDGDILDFDLQEVSVSQTILRQARQSILVADHTKFTRSAPVRIASLRDVDTFYTDAPLPPALTERCEEWDTRVEMQLALHSAHSGARRDALRR